MYNKVDTNMNFVDREKETEKFWRENDIFKKSMENRKEGETYTFYDGPPTANGKPHIGHVETRTIKDMIPRFQTMKGKYVPRKAYRKRQAAHRSRADPCYQGYDSEIPYYEGLHGSEKGWMGYPRSSGRNRSGETSWTGWKGSDRSIWS